MLDIESPLEMALAYAGRGWHVFPLHTVIAGVCDCRDKYCVTNAGKHPRTAHGFKDATVDEEQIRKWWGMWPEANVGIATGAVSGLLVVDIDPRNGGDESCLKLMDQGKVFPRGGPRVLTHSGGDHLYYAYPNVPIKKMATIAKGIDLKGDGGYVVAPPSRGKEGRYAWVLTGDLVAL